MKQRLAKLFTNWPTAKAINMACVVGLISLAVMAVGILIPQPLEVVASMSVSQGLGAVACLLYGLSIAADSLRAPPPGSGQG
jgi:hypothetical protein